MNGSEAMVKTLLAGEIDVCFANPGTSEMHFVSALDRAPGMRCVRGTRSFARLNIRRRGSFSLTGKCLSCRRQTPPRSPKMS